MVQGELFSSSLLPTFRQTQSLCQLLRTNLLPTSPPEFHPGSVDVESVISLAPAELARYDEDIARLHAALDAHRSMIKMQTEARAVLQDYSDRCASVFAPVRRLPPEILKEIFALCAPAPPKFFEGHPSFAAEIKPGRIAQAHLLCLSQVCSNWHTTAMKTPSLWATIEVDLPLAHVAAATLLNLMHVLSRSLERSAGCPLAIHVRAKHPSPLLTVLARHSERWRTVDLFVCHRSLAALSGVKGHVPLLERLQLGGCSSLRNRMDIFETAPRLTQAVFSKFGTAPGKLPWNQLRRVTYTNVYPPMALDRGLATMLGSPSEGDWDIRNLHVSHLSLPLPELTPIHSAITRLSLQLVDSRNRDHSREVLGGILRALTLPQLRHLRLESLHRRGRRLALWPQEQFSMFASQSSCRETLQELLLIGVIITEDDLLACLSSLPTLKSLRLTDIPASATVEAEELTITNGLLQNLTWVPRADCITPRLAHIALDSLLGFSDDIMLNFVESRLFSGRSHTLGDPFRMVISRLPRDTGTRELNVSVAMRIQELVAQGDLDFQLMDAPAQ
ncbi:hypothetical protein C8F04DRAFT_1128229 [Mycena alexandri]|uniref:F-box domain-containing protein n=1 Tax=Mycena alexandri TaxID=1745969 RepID=A0AAD6WSI2_9AGAR|nr:hypothetical protein C8F04DRAFT_1128229 [Mycena alexandri]